jgi:hypothetical protein
MSHSSPFRRYFPVFMTRRWCTDSNAQGFRMRVGSPMRRTEDDIDPNDATTLHALTFRCFNGTDGGSGGATTGFGPEDSFEFPNRTCSGGIRSNIYFPQ